MNKLTAALGIAMIGLSTATIAAEPMPDSSSDSARQARMDEAYRDQQAHRPGLAERTEMATKRDAHKVGHAIKNGFHKTGAAIHHGAEKTSDAFHRNVKPSDHAVHDSTDKVNGHP